MKDSTWVERLTVVGIGFILVVMILTCFRGCTDESGARRVLEQQGYTQIEITGYRPFMSEDQFSTGFKAVSPNGSHVSGAVTSGVMKGYTIRLD